VKSADSSSYHSAFYALAQLVDIGVLVVTPDRTLDFISPRARQLLHCPPSEQASDCWEHARAVIEPVLDRANADTDDPLHGSVSLDEGASAQDLELEIHRLRDAAHRLTAHLILIKDYDNFQRVEQSLRLAMQMYHTGRLYEALAHDLRQPIGAVLVHLKILEELESSIAVGTPHQAQYRESVDTIRSEIKELDDSLRLLLRELSPTDIEEAIRLGDMMKSVVQLIAPQVQKAGLSLATDLPAEDVVVQGRRFRIKQAILNLATNALEAMTAGSITLCLRTTQRYACIDVVDEGPGIPEHVQARMYDRHYTTKEDGTGLGLHIVKQTAEAHGGQVEAHSVIGEGATFSLYLPLVPEASSRPRASAAPNLRHPA
jgi:signal transduction histidine kinase